MFSEQYRNNGTYQVPDIPNPFPSSLPSSFATHDSFSHSPPTAHAPRSNKKEVGNGVMCPLSLSLASIEEGEFF